MYNEPSATQIAATTPTSRLEEHVDSSSTISFANGSHASSNKDLIISNTYTAKVLPQHLCPNNLLPEKALSDLDCTTTFHRDTCTITPPTKSQRQAIIIHRNPETNLFHANLEDVHELIQALDPSNTPHHSIHVEAPCTDCHAAYSAVLTHHPQTSIQYKVLELHERMGHPPSETMCAAVQGPDPAWKNTGLTAKQIRRVFSKYTCIPCAAGKRRLNAPVDRSNDDRRKWEPGECFSCDPAVKINPLGFDGSDCFFLFKDLATGYLYAVITESKKSSCFIEAFKEVLSFFAQNKCCPTQILRSDSEAIFLSAEVLNFLRDKNIASQTSAPDCHFQVSVERDMQTVFKSLSTILSSKPHLRYDLWPLALKEYIARKNRTPNKRCFPKSPHQVVTKSSTDLSREYVYKFGDVVLTGTVDRQRDTDFDPKNDVGIYIGQEPGTVNAHRVYYPHKRKIRVNGYVSKLEVTEQQLNEWIANRNTALLPAYDVIEDVFYDFLNPPKPQQEPLQGEVTIIEPTVQQPNTTVTLTAPPDSNNLQLLNSLIGGEEILRHFDAEERQAMLETKFLTLLSKYATLLIQQQQQQTKPSNKRSVRSRSPTPHPSAPTHSMTLRNRSPIVSSAISLDNVHLFLPTNATYQHYYGLSALYCNAAQASKQKRQKGKNDPHTPLDNDSPTVHKAMMMPDREEWKKAIRAEINSLLVNTLKQVDLNNFPPGSYIMIHTTTQLKRKRNAITCKIEKYKARECARGDLIAGLLSASETYSPTVSPITFALILQLAVIMKMKRKTVDTVGAYLYQTYPTNKRTLLTRLNKEVAEICNLDPNIVYRIERYIYGLPDAGKAYYEAYSKHLIENGYIKSSFDPCLFFKINADETTYVVIHVDDTFIFSTTDEAINSFTNMLQSKFDITVNDDADSYLGVSFEEDENGNIKLHQPKLIQSLLEQYSTQLQSPPDSINITEYQQLLGTLMYLTKSRPDIQTSISFAATHSKSPKIEHYHSLLKLVNYIKRTQNYGLIIRRYDYANNEPLQLVCHVDASYLTHEDSKSHTGYTLSFGNVGTFFSKSSKQPLVATSSTHAEARALYTLLQDIIYIISICNELRINLKLPVQVFEDNYPVVQLTNNLAPKAKKCKHFLMLLNFIKEQIDEGIIEVKHIDTDENIADVLTKLLTGSPFYSKADKLLGHQLDETSKRQRKDD